MEVNVPGIAKGKEDTEGQHKEKLKWKRPDARQLKVNTNGAWINQNREACIGYIVRDKDGEALMAVSTHLRSPSPLFSELMSIRYALMYLYTSPLEIDKKIIIESNCLEPIKAINDAQSYPSWRFEHYLTKSGSCAREESSFEIM